jgi:hypothetical protein
MTDDAGIGRQTPYEMVFGEERFAGQEFPAIEEESRTRGINVWDRDRFATMDRVGAILLQMIPEDLEVAALVQHTHILFHCYHFWNAGCPIYAFDAATAASLIESAPDLGSWRFRAPHSALYIELPRSLFWVEMSADDPPEPVEGIFVVRDPSDQSAELGLLLVMGMRADRAGFSVVGLTADPEAARELEEPGAFQSDIPGAELAELYSLRRASEAVMLSLRLLWYVDSYPNSLVPAVGGGQRGSGYIVPTTLDHFQTRLVDRSDG